MKEINSSSCIVAYLDILGYKDWTRKSNDPSLFFDQFEQILQQNKEIKKEYEQAEEFFNAMVFNIWADAFVFVVDLSKVKGFEKIQLRTSWFLYYLSLFVTKFIAETGYLLRGAITHGDYLRKNLGGEEDHAFIYSEAYVKAVTLEKVANMPRILIDNSFMKFCIQKMALDHFGKQAINTNIFKEEELDYYYYLKLLPQKNKESALSKIATKIKSHFAEIESKKVKDKFYWFSDYHNNYLHEMLPARINPEEVKSFGDPRDILLTLRDIGILEQSDEGFCIKKEIGVSSMYGVQALCRCKDISDDLVTQLGDLLRYKIHEKDDKIRKYELSISRNSKWPFYTA